MYVLVLRQCVQTLWMVEMYSSIVIYTVLRVLYSVHQVRNVEQSDKNLVTLTIQDEVFERTYWPILQYIYHLIEKGL